MNSAGNDIVSLAKIDVLRTKTSRFYSKILSVNEVEGYYKPQTHTIPFEHYIWLLWAMKEAAYKFLKRIEPELNFIPVKFWVKELSIANSKVGAVFNISPTVAAQMRNNIFFRATVETGGYKVYAAAVISEEVIFAFISDAYGFDDVFCGLQIINDPDPANQSSSARELLQEAISAATGYTTLSFHKDAYGIPVLYGEDKGVTIPVSIAHHGRYIGYSFKYDGCIESKIQRVATE